MASIELVNASVAFRLYDSSNRSIRSDIFKRVGGVITSRNGESVTVQALSDITLSLKPGDRLAIVGHNGAGKSTLLRLLSGAYEPSSGTAAINGKVSSLLDFTMGMDPELTGRQNIIMRAVFLGQTFAQARELVPGVIDFSELGAYVDLPVRTYSSGMMLRLAFAVSTAVQPDIILLDEMVSVGDARFAIKARERIQSLVARAPIFALASHSPAMLREYCTTAVWLKEGRIAGHGTIDDILAQQAAETGVPLPAVAAKPNVAVALAPAAAATQP